MNNGEVSTLVQRAEEELASPMNPIHMPRFILVGVLNAYYKVVIERDTLLKRLAAYEK